MGKFMCLYEIHASKQPHLSHAHQVWENPFIDRIADLHLKDYESLLLYGHQETGWTDATDVRIISIISVNEP